MEFLDVGRCLEVEQSLYLFWVCLYHSFVDHVSNELARGNPKGTLCCIELHFVVFEDLKFLAKINYVVNTLLALHKNIVHTYFHSFVNFILEHFSDQLLLDGSSVFQSKGHDLVAVKFHCYDEGYVFLVWAEQWNLMIPRVCIKETHYFMPCCRVYQLINLGKGEAVFRASHV